MSTVVPWASNRRQTSRGALQDLEQLRRELRGSLLIDGQWSTHFDSDYSGLYRSRCKAIARVADREDVACVVRWARAHDWTVTARGHGCSSTGLVCGADLVIDVADLTSYARVGDDRIRVGAGWRWVPLQDRLSQDGLACRVLTDNSYASVGGTLSVGGYGSASYRYASQCDQVVAFSLITAAGDLVEVRRSERPELFDFVLGGMGKLGVMVDVEMRVEPARPWTEVSRIRLPLGTKPSQVIEFVNSIRPDHLLCTYLFRERQWMIWLGTSHAEAPKSPKGFVVPRFEKMLMQISDLYRLKRAGLWTGYGEPVTPQSLKVVWGDYFVAAPHADEMFDVVTTEFHDHRATTGLYSVVIRGDAGFARPALPLLPMAPWSSGFSFGPYCAVPEHRVPEYRGKFDRCRAECHDMGGRLYLYAYHPTGERAFYERQFGVDTVKTWLSAKQRWDPQHVFGPIINE